MTWGEEEELVEKYRQAIRTLRDTISRSFHRVKGAGGAEYFVGKIHSQRYYSVGRRVWRLLNTTHDETEALKKLRNLLMCLKELGLDELRPLGGAKWGCDSDHNVISGPVWDDMLKEAHLLLSH